MVEYLDLNGLLSDKNGLLNKEYSSDGIHPNNEGYSIIAEVINEKLQDKINKKLILDTKI